ncbi:MAG: TlpA family protein disulfide reductase [Kofleriaceae bacterium]|nr:TlpA family protein disulfide reductase [Kofleriaceae bacterium]
MRTQTLIGLFVAATIAVVVVLFVATSGGEVKKTTVGIPTAAPTADATAKAACDSAANGCLPAVQFVDIDGKAYTPSSLVGKVVIVNFWATWCGPCQKEIPAFSRIYEKYKDQGVLFLGVMTDSPDAQTLLNFASDYNLTYPIIRVNQDINGAFGPQRALPTTIIYDRAGKQIKRIEGGLSEDSLEQFLAPLVASK